MTAVIVVTTEWNTDADGNWIEDKESEQAITHHGPFPCEAMAISWIECNFEDDTDVFDMYITDELSMEDLGFVNPPQVYKMECIKTAEPAIDFRLPPWKMPA